MKDEMLIKSEKEYNGFGPWYVEIESDVDIPDHFMNHFKVDSDIVMAYKIPIGKERRTVKLGDTLYPKLISLARDKLVFYDYGIDSKHVSEKVIYYNTISYIKDEKNLLLGTLTLVMNTDSYSINYNSVSDKIISKIITFLRNKYLEGVDCKTKDSEGTERPDLSNLNLTYTNVFNSFYGNEEHLGILYYHDEKSVGLKAKNIGRRIFDLYAQPVLQGWICMTAKKELILVSRIKGIRRKVEADYSFAYKYIPYSRIEEVTITENKRFEGVQDLNIRVDNSLESFQTFENCIEIFRDYLGEDISCGGTR
jgi:hypothetical protein